MPTSTLATVAHQRGDLVFAPWPCHQSIFDADTSDAVEYLAPFLGPSCVVVLNYLARRLKPPTISMIVSLADLSHASGAGPHPASHGRIVRVLVRLEQFGYLQHDGSGHCQVRIQIPPLTPPRIARLPVEFQHNLPRP